MTANYWLDPVQPGRIFRALLESLAGDATVAVEGEQVALRGLRLEAEPGARVGPAGPFRAEHGPSGHMVILPLENREQAEALCRLLAPGGELRSEMWTAVENRRFLTCRRRPDHPIIIRGEAASCVEVLRAAMWGIVARAKKEAPAV